MIKVIFGLISLLILGACNGPNSDTDDAALTLILEPAPAGYTGAYLIVTVADAESNPVTDAQVSLEGNMNHAGMAPVLTERVQDDEDGAMDGSYRVPFEFTMLGDRIITVKVEQADGRSEEQDIKVSVSEAEVLVRE